MKIFSHLQHEIAKRNPYFSFNQEKFSHLALTDWMAERIEKDLQHHKKVTITDIEQTLLHSPGRHIYPFMIRSNRLISPSLKQSLPHSRLRKMVFFFRQILPIFPFPDVTFLFSLHDLYEHPEWLETTKAPVFVISKTEGNQKASLFPHVEWLTQWLYIRRRLEKKQIPWEQKKEQLVWRGSTTGDKKGVRWAVHELAKKHPQHLDAGFCYLAQQGASDLKKPLLPEEQITYKYLLALDGNCFPGSFFWQLSSRSLVFKQHSPYLEWYYEGLKPYEHYIPFSKDGSDLLEKKLWVEQHQSLAKEMACNAQAFADQFLSIESTVFYVYQLLRRYSLLTDL